MPDWQEVTGELGQIIRWNEKPANDAQAEKTKFVGLSVEGVYCSRKDNIGQNAATMYEVRTQEHGLLSIWDTTVLKDKMNEVPVGSEVLIECLGEQPSKSGGKSYLGFKVMFKEAPMVEAGAPDEPELPEM